MVVEGTSHFFLYSGPSADPSVVVDPVPIIHHQVCLTMALTKPATQPKTVAAKGKGDSCLVTQLRACKVTWLASPSPQVTEATAPASPVSGPSWVTHPPLFEEPAVLGDKDVRAGVPTTSGE